MKATSSKLEEMTRKAEEHAKGERLAEKKIARLQNDCETLRQTLAQEKALREAKGSEKDKEIKLLERQVSEYKDKVQSLQENALRLKEEMLVTKTEASTIQLQLSAARQAIQEGKSASHTTDTAIDALRQQLAKSVEQEKENASAMAQRKIARAQAEAKIASWRQSCPPA